MYLERTERIFPKKNKHFVCVYRKDKDEESFLILENFNIFMLLLSISHT